MSQCLVTATIKDPLGNLYANALVIASFVGQNTTPGSGPYFDGGIPSGQFEPIVPTQSTSAGTISFLLTRNDTIQPGPSQWRFTVVDQTGKVSFAVLITISGATQDISAALQAASANLPSTVFPNINVTGSLTAKIIENVRNAADYAGADWCAKVTAADADLGASTFGEIWVTQLANTGGACAAAPTLSPGHALRFTQGGVYSISVGWTINNYGHWMILGDELTYISFTGTSGFVADGSAFGNDMQNIVIRNIVFSGNLNIANAATFHNVARSTFENMHGINATTNGLWFRGVIVCTFKHVGSSVNMFNGAIIPIAYTVFPTNFINFDQNQASTSASIGNTGDIFAECGVHGSTTGVLFNFLVGSELDVTTAEGCATGINLAGGSFGNPMLRLGDLEQNTTNDLVIAGFQNRLTFRSVSNIASAVSVSGNDNFISGQCQNTTVQVGAQGNHFQNYVYSTQGAGGTFTDNSSPSSTTKIKVRNGNTGTYDPDVLGGTRLLLLNGTDAITSNPVFGNLGNGWRIGIAGYGIGLGANTLAFGFGGNAWMSFCNGGLANGATVSAPDANCGINFAGPGTIWMRQVAAPTGLANVGQFWFDSTANRYKMNNNNAGATNLMGASDVTLTLKKGTGAGNYTTASTTYVVVDSANLCQTVTIPTGTKLMIHVSGAIGTATAAVAASLAVTDNAACSTANAGILVETTETTTAAGVLQPVALNWVITGDGASHNVALQFKTSNAADSATIANSSATLLPTMTTQLIPSN